MAQGNLSPRQKMINLMYLVLTAMLALNVSNEVLDAFLTIENRFGNSIAIVQANNETNFKNFDVAAENSSVEKVKPWKDKAEIVKRLTNELFDYIFDLKKELVIDADGNDSPALQGNIIDANKLKNRDATDVGTRLFYGYEEKPGKGFDLKAKIEAYKEALVQLVDDDDPQSKNIINTIQGMLDTKDKGHVGIDELNRSWVYATFYNAPVISDLAILSSIQLDLRNSEAQMLNYLLTQIDASSFKFSELQAAVIPNSSYIIKGTPLEVKVFLAAYDPTVRPVAKIGNSEYQSDEKGQILYSSIQNSVGAHHLKGVIEFPGPEGVESVPFDFPYQVGEASAVVSPTKMNVFYVGVENPVDISVSGVPQEKITPVCSGGELRRQGGTYVVVPAAGSKEVVISISAEINGTRQTLGSKKFRVKRLPTPIPRANGIAGRSASKGELQASLGVMAKMPDDFDFDLRYTVTSFRLSLTVNGYEKEEISNSANFTQGQKALLNSVRSGQRIFITDIKATGPGGTVELPTLDIKVK